MSDKNNVDNKKLDFEYKNYWRIINSEKKKEAFEYCDGYIQFLNEVKTEREFVDYALKLAKKKGFVNIEDLLDNKQKLTPGMKVYQNIRSKSLVLAVIGSDDPAKGFNFLGSHIDAPRIDFKQNPIYEDTDFVLAKTHYYGGIKKYQWLSIPLAIHGVVVKKKGEVVKVCIGEDENDPVFTITDLLPHLAHEQMQKKMSEAVPGESLNLLLGSMPIENAEKDAKNIFKKNILELFYDRYGIDEQDFTSAEIEIVPAFKAKNVGLDKSMVGGYGQDDRVCAYTSLSAILECENPHKTAISYFSDKEEVGSMGNTGAQSKIIENFIAYICYLTTENYNDIALRQCLTNSRMLSCDVTSAVDPNFEGVQDKRNASYFSKGVVLEKYTGSRGKAGASDANPEFIALLRKMLDDHEILWQTGEMGRVDLGGGGTIAQFMANLGMDVIDCGVPVLSMHSTFEITSKADIYNTYRAYKVFLQLN